MKDLKLLKNLNVLFVDDDKETREKLNSILSYYFNRVFLASNGIEALKIYQNNVCNFLMVDYDMPIMNGYEFLKEIRKIDDKVPAIILSSYDDKEKLKSAIKLNLIEYLVKPYEVSELKSVFTSCLDWIETKGLLKFCFNEKIFYSISEKAIFSEEKKIALTAYEIKALEILIKNQTRVVTYEEMLNNLGDETTQKSMFTIIYKLKKKIPLDIIKNIKDFGYVLAL